MEKSVTEPSKRRLWGRGRTAVLVVDWNGLHLAVCIEEIDQEILICLLKLYGDLCVLFVGVGIVSECIGWDLSAEAC